MSTTTPDIIKCPSCGADLYGNLLRLRDVKEVAELVMADNGPTFAVSELNPLHPGTVKYHCDACGDPLEPHELADLGLEVLIVEKAVA